MFICCQKIVILFHFYSKRPFLLLEFNLNPSHKLYFAQDILIMGHLKTTKNVFYIKIGVVHKWRHGLGARVKDFVMRAYKPKTRDAIYGRPLVAINTRGVKGLIDFYSLFNLSNVKMCRTSFQGKLNFLSNVKVGWQAQKK